MMNATAAVTKPVVKVHMIYNTGLPAGSRTKTILPASWTAKVDVSTLPREFTEAPGTFEASGFTRSQALLGVERMLKGFGLACILEIQG